MRREVIRFGQNRRNGRQRTSDSAPRHKQRKSPKSSPLSTLIAMIAISVAGAFSTYWTSTGWHALNVGDAGLSLFGATTEAIPRLHARNMPICGWGKRTNCVVDGDTFYLDGEKIRIVNIDAPEVDGRCVRETRLAAEATARLRSLLENQRVAVTRTGTDRFGRTLAKVSTGRGEVGGALIRDGLAQHWNGRKAEWCNA